MKMTKLQWIEIGNQTGWLKAAQANTSYRTQEAIAIDQAIRHINTFRENGSITLQQFHEQMGRIKQKIVGMKDAEDKTKLTALFNPSYYDKIEPSKTRTAQVVGDDNLSRRRTVKVTMSDGDVITTEINGTKKEIEDYYLKHNFVKDDEVTMHHGVKVEFLS